MPLLALPLPLPAKPPPPVEGRRAGAEPALSNPPEAGPPPGALRDDGAVCPAGNNATRSWREVRNWDTTDSTPVSGAPPGPGSARYDKGKVHRDGVRRSHILERTGNSGYTARVGSRARRATAQGSPREELTTYRPRVGNQQHPSNDLSRLHVGPRGLLHKTHQQQGHVDH